MIQFLTDDRSNNPIFGGEKSDIVKVSLSIICYSIIQYTKSALLFIFYQIDIIALISIIIYVLYF